MNNFHQVVCKIYNLFSQLPRYNYQTPRNLIPSNGIYVFYEKGESIVMDNKLQDRIVRIGTHKSDGRLKDCIRQHYGRVNSLGGNKNSSVFRKHLGGALLRRDNPDDPRFKEWITQDGLTYKEIEEQVSQLMRDNFTFCCFEVRDREERLYLERGLIALLSRYPLGKPSDSWLGHHAAAEEIRSSGLWNTQHVDSKPLTLEEYRRLEELVKPAERRWFN